MKLLETMKDYKIEYLPKDILSGIIIAAVSIPIAMGYAEVSGLPGVYGLYGSVLPILVFALFSTSYQFIFGVDAAPAAIVGAALSSAGILSGSPEALNYVPMIALFSGLWLLVFYVCRAGRMVDYISTPVMGGFISGIAVTIILMQIPKMLGSGSGSGELPELLRHIFHACKNINLLSLLLGSASLLIILISRKLFPKFPMVIVIMAGGVALTCFGHVDNYGVRLLPQVERGFPAFVLQDFSGVDMVQVIGRALVVAVVIMAETLLSENNFAFKNGYRIRDDRELLACGLGNAAAALVGCCPVNGSISRTSMNEQYGGQTQLVSVIAALTMLFVLLFGTGFIGFLPVPVLTAIVISALMKVVEFDLAISLFRVSRSEFRIFMGAFLGVLLLGTIYGVIIGMVLSFVAVILKVTNPPRDFLGVIPGRDGFYSLKRNQNACEIQGIKIYQFSENLYFANIKILQEDVDAAVDSDVKAFILDLRYVTGIDVTAAERLELLAADFEKRGIRFYLTEHQSGINDMLRRFGIDHLIREGHVRRTITAALHDLGLSEPYVLVKQGEKEQKNGIKLSAEMENSMEEFAWAFGEDTVNEIENRVHMIMEQVHQLPELEQLLRDGPENLLDSWHQLGAIDEDELLRRMELHLDELPPELNRKENRRLIWKLLEEHRQHIRERVEREHPEAAEKLLKYRQKLEQRLEKQNPEAARRLHDWETQWEPDTEN